MTLPVCLSVHLPVSVCTPACVLPVSWPSLYLAGATHRRQSLSVTLELSMGAALSNVPLCSRAGGDDVDSNNNLHTETDNNQARAVVVDSQPAPVQTSTPKLERETGGDSQQDSLDFGPGSDRTFGSDSGLEHSGDELELSRYVLDLDAAVDTEEEDEEDEDENGKEEETLESLQSGDLGIDRSTTFRVIKKEEEEEEEEEQRENVLRK